MSKRRNSIHFNFLLPLVILFSIILAGCEGAAEEESSGPAVTKGDPACLTDSAGLVAQINNLTTPDIGGRLYDKWWAERGSTQPTTNHPLWSTRSQPTINTRSGADTWRCKECHGWDYAGREGVYGDTSNSHYTGFPGILQSNGDSAINVFCAIKKGTNIDSRHDFSGVMQDGDILNLTRFILETQAGNMPLGIIDTTDHITPSGTIRNAVHTNGEILFGTAGCSDAGCHGPNGDLHEEPLGELSRDNPWETLHKIRFGHPASTMPAFTNYGAASLTLAQAKDIVAHAQLLTPTTACSTDPNVINLVSNVDVADAAQGGQLYDKWWVAAGTAIPTDDHPLWSTRAQQTINTRTGADTWRCKECHGWDYDGVEGVYGDTGNSHYTGFPSILTRTAGAQPIDVFCAIRSGEGISSAHSFGSVMSDSHILHLTRFITAPQTGTMPRGVIDTTSLIDTASGALIGANATNGATQYNSQGCGTSNCHGTLGDAQHEWLGDLADGNPWETLHKIRFGHPGSIPQMPSFSESITLAVSNDIIAHAQTLPNAPAGGGGGGTPPPLSDAATIALGGRLYDNWIAETGATAPPTDNPVWQLQPDPNNQNTRTGAATWRCKECHGWDYKGVDGVYGDPSSSHYTGFGGILNTEKTEQDIVSYLTTGFYNPILGQEVHKFDGLLTTAQMEALAAFIKQGMVDTSPFFGSDAIINGPKANYDNGAYLYSFVAVGVPTAMCELCHDPDGLGQQGVNLGDIARTNPWEFLHKIRFGQPATAMPSMFEAVNATGGPLFDIQDSVDIIQYSQGLNLP